MARHTLMNDKGTLHCLLKPFQPRPTKYPFEFWKQILRLLRPHQESIPQQYIWIIVEIGVEHHSDNPSLTSAVTLVLFVYVKILSTLNVNITHGFMSNKGNNKSTELRTILQRESQNSYVYKQTKSVKTVKTVMTEISFLAL